MEKLFNKVIEYGKYVRENNLNGLNAWSDIKDLFNLDIKCPKWNIIRNIGGKETSDIEEIYSYVYANLDMRGEDSDDDKSSQITHLLWEKKHFFLQLIRIIKNNPEFSFVRLGQIAYNIGQISVYIDSDPIYRRGQQAYYYSNKLNELESYVNIVSCKIDSDKLEELEKQIDEKLNELKELKKGGNLNHYNKYLKYKQKYLKLKHKLKKQVGGETGKDIIKLLNRIINIFDSSGVSGVQSYLQDHNITLHQDQCNPSSIEENIQNIRTIINMFNEKYIGRLEKGYSDFDDYATGSYVCLDAKIDALTNFLVMENPFTSGRSKDTVLSNSLIKIIYRLCNDPLNNSLSYYRNKNNIDNIKRILKDEFNLYIDKGITKEEINNFVDLYIIDHLDEIEVNILACDGKLEELRRRPIVKKILV